MNTSKISIITLVIITIILISCENNAKELPPSEIYINMPDSGYEVRVTDTLIISPKITYDYNSTYTWKVDGVVKWTQKYFTLIPKELDLYRYVFTIENSRGIDSFDIKAQSMYLTDFEDLTLYESTNSDKKIDTFWVNASLQKYFISDSIKFEVNGSYNNESWTGFTYSNMSGDKTSDEYDKYSSYKSPSTYESDHFGVMMQDEIQTALMVETNDGENHLFKSLMVNNSYYVYDAIKSGNHGSKQFGGEDGTDTDWYMLTITGFNKSGTQRGKVEFYLANYTFGNNRDNYIITNWTSIDLKPLGEVSKLKFELSSSDINTVDNKMITPGFVCIDEIKIIQ